MFVYQLRLAVSSLRKDLGLSTAMFVCLGLGAGLWTTVVCHYLREFPPDAALPADLHQVELEHPRARALDKNTVAQESSWHARTWVTFPEYQRLASSGIPSRQTGSFRAQVLLSADGLSTAHPRNARFTDADFFSLFRIPLGHGRAFTRDEANQRAGVVVLGQRLATALFGPGDCINRGLLLEGRPFRVIGVLDGDQPVHPDWDIVWNGHDQDGLYVPIAWAQPLGAWPDRMIFQSAVAAPAELWRSDSVFVSFWAQLETAEQRARYERYLAERLGPGAGGARLRNLAEWRRAFPMPTTDVFFFTILLAMGLIGAAFTTARLLLAKGLARRNEVGVHRALGATRRAIFARQMLEAALVATPAVVVAIVIALVQHAFFNRVVLDNDIPVQLTWRAAALGGLPSFLVGLAAAAYPAWRISRTPPTFRGERT